MRAEPLQHLDFDGPGGRWRTDLIAEGVVHIRPIGDLTDHPLVGDCVCGPRTEAVFRPDGSNGWMHVHHSLDGREQHE